MKIVYLAHPFAKKEVGTLVQQELEILGLKVLNPFVRPQQAEFEAALKSPQGLSMDQSRLIVELDLNLIDEAHGTVALLIDNSMIGTLMEIFYTGYVVKKPVFCLAWDERYLRHPWIKTMSTGIYTTQAALEHALDRWMNGH